MLRRMTIMLLTLYALLTAYSALRLSVGLPNPPFLTPLLTLIGFTFALLHAGQRLGWRLALLLLILCFTVSLLFESVGVATGLVYGPYHYTDKLGPRFLGLVPYLIATAWFMMMYPSLVIAQSLAGRSGLSIRSILAVSATGGVIMTAWDLAMDPLMAGGGFWVWDGPLATRPYFGIPLQNFWGWWLTTFLTFFLFMLISRKWQRQPEAESTFDRLAILSYLVTGLSTIATNMILGLGGPAMVGLFAMSPWVYLGWQEPGPR